MRARLRQEGFLAGAIQPITLGCKMLQAVFMLQILLAEYQAMARREWSTKMLTVGGVDDVP